MCVMYTFVGCSCCGENLLVCIFVQLSACQVVLSTLEFSKAYLWASQMIFPNIYFQEVTREFARSRSSSTESLFEMSINTSKIHAQEEREEWTRRERG